MEINKKEQNLDEEDFEFHKKENIFLSLEFGLCLWYSDIYMAQMIYQGTVVEFVKHHL